jgi:hypothetical protein
MIEVTEDVFPVPMRERVRKWLRDPAMQEYLVVLTHQIAHLELQATSIVAERADSGKVEIGAEAGVMLKQSEFLKQVQKLLKEHAKKPDEFAKISIAVIE